VTRTHAQLPRELDAVHVGHVDVADDHVRGADRQELERFDSVARLDDVVAGALQGEGDHAPDRRSVVNGEDRCCHSCTRGLSVQ